MRTRVTLALAALALLIAASPVAAQAEKQGKIVMLGDSITKYGLPEAASAPLNELTRGKVAWTLVNAGVGGETAEVGKTRLPALLQAEKPDLLTVSYGLNDLAQNHKPEQFRANLLEILDLAAKQSPATRVILLTATPFDPRTSLSKNKTIMDQGGPDLVLELKFNSIVRQIAAEKNLPLIDLHRYFMTDPEWTRYIKPDGVHFVPEGYTFCGKYLAAAIAAWYETEVARDAKGLKVRDQALAQLKEVAAAIAKEADKPEGRKQLLAKLDAVWRACPYLPPQAAIWHAVYYAGKTAEPAKSETPKPQTSAAPPKPDAPAPAPAKS